YIKTHKNRSVNLWLTILELQRYFLTTELIFVVKATELLKKFAKKTILKLRNCWANCWRFKFQITNNPSIINRGRWIYWQNTLRKNTTAMLKKKRQYYVNS